MKKIKYLFAGILVSLVFIACDNSAKENSNSDGKTAFVAITKMSLESLEVEIKKREDALNTDSSAMDRNKATDLMEAYAVYAEKFSNRANSAERLFKAGEIAMGLNETVKAIRYLDVVYSEYPDYEKRPYALFLRAFVLENQAADFVQAKELYQEFIDQYPGHQMADDAKYSIANMGKSPEELIREFEIQDSLRRAQESS